MKQTASSWVVIGLIAAIGLGVGADQWCRIHEIEAARAEIERQQAAAQAELRKWEMRAAAAEQTRQTLQATLAAASPTKDAASLQPPKPAPAPSYAERLQKDPVFQLLHLAADRAHLLATYGALFRKLGLSPDKIGEFQEIAVKRKERELDLQSVITLKHLTSEDPAIKKMQQDNEAEFATAQRALLGEAGYKSFQDYDRTSDLREMVAGWAGGAVVAIREPFTAEQGEGLVQIMANASASYRHGGSAGTDEPGYWSAVEAEAQKILSPAQLRLFATMEPPLPMGARYQAQLYIKVDEALTADKAPAIETKAPGG